MGSSIFVVRSLIEDEESLGGTFHQDLFIRWLAVWGLLIFSAVCLGDCVDLSDQFYAYVLFDVSGVLEASSIRQELLATTHRVSIFEC